MLPRCASEPSNWSPGGRRCACGSSGLTPSPDGPRARSASGPSSRRRAPSRPASGARPRSAARRSCSTAWRPRRATTTARSTRPWRPRSSTPRSATSSAATCSCARRDLPAAARARRPGEPVPVALTFDDDLPSHREHAAPVLARHGAPATAFLCGADGPFWWQLLQRAIDDRAVAADWPPARARRRAAAALDRRPGAIARGRAADRGARARRARRASPRGCAAAVPTRRAVLAAGRRRGARRGRAGRSASTPAGTTSSRALDDDALRAAVAPPGAARARSPTRTARRARARRPLPATRATRRPTPARPRRSPSGPTRT